MHIASYVKRTAVTVQVCGSHGHTAGFINGGSVYLDCKSGMLTRCFVQCVFIPTSHMTCLMLTLHVCCAGPNKPCYL